MAKHKYELLGGAYVDPAFTDPKTGVVGERVIRFERDKLTVVESDQPLDQKYAGMFRLWNPDPRVVMTGPDKNAPKASSPVEKAEGQISSTPGPGDSVTGESPEKTEDPPVPGPRTMGTPATQTVYKPADPGSEDRPDDRKSAVRRAKVAEPKKVESELGEDCCDQFSDCCGEDKAVIKAGRNFHVVNRDNPNEPLNEKALTSKKAVKDFLGGA